ncbi:MAG: TatA/E family twin arginine-targeting protein translocase [Negativicutes bacterium]
MFGLGMPELILILIIALVIFGPSKLPEMGASVGKAIREFRNATKEPDPEPDRKVIVAEYHETPKQLSNEKNSNESVPTEKKPEVKA